MAVLFRFLLFAVLIYLIVRMIRKFFSAPKEDDKNVKTSSNGRKVSKDVGDYVDYEEIEGKEPKAKGEKYRKKDQGSGDFR
jgi:hypothetical protein